MTSTPNVQDGSKRPPNILLIMTDQQRANFTADGGLGCDTMPVLDDLSRAGASFSHAYTSYPACVPARTSLLTGRFPTAHRVRQNSTAEHAHYDRDLVDVLKQAGYQVHFAGKTHMHREAADFDTFAGPYWHNSGPERSDGDRAFDQWLDDLDHGVATEPTPFPLEHQLPYRIVSDAITVLASGDTVDPLFLWVSFPEPHNPYQVPEPYFSLFPEDEVPDRIAGPEAMTGLTKRYRWLRALVEDKRPGYDDQWRRYRANYLGMLRLIDDQIERLLTALGERAQDTLVVFVSDHGDYVGEYGLQRKGAGMSDFLMRIPMMFSGAGVVGGQRRRELVSIVDLLPTICEVIGADVPPGVQGRSLAPLLRGDQAPQGEFDSVYAEMGYGGMSYGEDEHPPVHFPYPGKTFDELNSVTQSGGERMVRLGDHKLIVDETGNGQLFDLLTDPAELRNLYHETEYAQVRERLLAVLVPWMIRVADDLPVGAYRAKTAAHNWRWGVSTSPSLPTTRTGGAA